ncbi:uncharacterized protein LOC112568579 isoform X3 [Pomacea canaliculata]|uniref:uncharacterized protein LOC112568579 isoform X3 n=1 Tax=Pomacea canaliculata TaxID=400727 RepID=UPI000D72ACBA|nr:uncharacterized protein LOC112568579 isoform X3 [Pomacea canaliculata]
MAYNKRNYSRLSSHLTMQNFVDNNRMQIKSNRIVPESCSVEMSGWSVSGWCTLEWMNNHNMPNCTWRLLYQNKIQSLQGSTNSVGHDSQDYRRVKCSFVHKIPAEDGNYTYSISISSHPADQYSKTFQIEKPNNLKHNCPETVPEGSSINCTCYASRRGNPSAKIAWDGSNSENFVINNVTRKSNGAVGVCRLTWGNMNITALYTISISFTMEHDEKSASAASAQGGLIGGVVTAVVVVVVIAAAAFVYFMKRRKTMLDSVEAGESGKERCIMGFSPHLREDLHGTTRLSTLCAVVNKPRTETTVEHHASPSDDLYTNVCTTNANKGQDEYAMICKTIENKTRNKESDGDDQVREASHEASQMKETIKPIIMVNPAILGNETFQKTSETIYVNVTQYPTESGLGVYHIVPHARNCGSSTLDANLYSAAITSDDEYNVLHFEKDRTGLEDQASPYNHLEQS